MFHCGVGVVQDDLPALRKQAVRLGLVGIVAWDRRAGRKNLCHRCALVPDASSRQAEETMRQERGWTEAEGWVQQLARIDLIV
eukprot:11480-Chlamydomonas_euryale.AAC.3